MRNRSVPSLRAANSVGMPAVMKLLPRFPPDALVIAVE
jgi:hypothetical protein